MSSVTAAKARRRRAARRRARRPPARSRSRSARRSSTRASPWSPAQRARPSPSRALLSAANAKKLKIARTIATKKATINAHGAALVNLGLTAKARKAVDKHLPQLKVTVEVAGGGVKKTATGTLTR